MDKKKVFPFEIRIRLQSYNLTSLKLLKKKLNLLALNSNLKCSSINLPIEKKKITVLKSPHVNKKARDQYEVSMLNCLVIFKSYHPSWDIYNKIQKMGDESLSMKLTLSTCNSDV